MVKREVRGIVDGEARSGKKKPKVGIGFGDSADGGARAGVNPILTDDDGGGNTFNLINIGTVTFLKVTAGQRT